MASQDERGGCGGSLVLTAATPMTPTSTPVNSPLPASVHSASLLATSPVTIGIRPRTGTRMVYVVSKLRKQQACVAARCCRRASAGGLADHNRQVLEEFGLAGDDPGEDGPGDGQQFGHPWRCQCVGHRQTLALGRDQAGAPQDRELL